VVYWQTHSNKTLKSRLTFRRDVLEWFLLSR